MATHHAIPIDYAAKPNKADEEGTAATLYGEAAYAPSSSAAGNDHCHPMGQNPATADDHNEPTTTHPATTSDVLALLFGPKRTFTDAIMCIMDPHTHLNTKSAAYRTTNEYRGFFYAIVVCVVIGVLAGPQLELSFKDEGRDLQSDGSYRFWWYAMTIKTIEDGTIISSSLVKTWDMECETARERILAAAVFACIALFFAAFTAYTSFADSKRNCIANCGFIQSNLGAVTKISLVGGLLTCFCLLLSFSLMAAFYNQTTWCTLYPTLPLSDMHWSLGSGINSCIAVWFFVMVAEVLRFYAIMAGWIPSVGEGEDETADGLNDAADPFIAHQDGTQGAVGMPI